MEKRITARYSEAPRKVKVLIMGLGLSGALGFATYEGTNVITHIAYAEGQPDQNASSEQPAATESGVDLNAGFRDGLLVVAGLSLAFGASEQLWRLRQGHNDGKTLGAYEAELISDT
jgi:hypothetical protein